MANSTFGVNILPKSNPVTLGNSDSPWTIVSPVFTGIPTAPTADQGTDSTQVATTAFVNNAVSGAFSAYGNEQLGQGYGTCGTEAATAAKTVTLSDYELETGGIVAVRFTKI